MEREAHAIRDAWATGGLEAAIAAMPAGMLDRFDFVGNLAGAVAHLARQQAAGIDLHVVSVVGGNAAAEADALRALADA
jgi:hypothetical protein